MVELNLTKISNGFIITETNTSYQFQTFLNKNEEEVQYEILYVDQAIFGTDKGIILLNTNCAIDDITYATIEEFIVALYA